MTNAILVGEQTHLFVHRLFTIIGKDDLGDTKTADGMLFHEVDHNSASSISQSNSLYPLGIFLSNHQSMSSLLLGLQTSRPNRRLDLKWIWG